MHSNMNNRRQTMEIKNGMAIFHGVFLLLLRFFSFERIKKNNIYFLRQNPLPPMLSSLDSVFVYGYWLHFSGAMLIV